MTTLWPSNGRGERQLHQARLGAQDAVLGARQLAELEAQRGPVQITLDAVAADHHVTQIQAVAHAADDAGRSGGPAAPAQSPATDHAHEQFADPGAHQHNGLDGADPEPEGRRSQ